MKRFKLCLFCLAIPFGYVWSQSSNLGNWFIYFGSQKIDQRWNWWNEVQYRNYNFAGDLEQLLLRTAIGYNLSENNNNLQLGYAFIHSQPYNAVTGSKTKVNEHRMYQQFLTRQGRGRLLLQHRYRFEQRFLNDDVRLRFRYLLSVNVALNKQSLEKNAVYASAYNEIFIHTKSPVFDRNRIYGGIGYVIHQNLKAETGLMYQVLETKSRPQWQIIFFNTLPFSGHK